MPDTIRPGDMLSSAPRKRDIGQARLARAIDLSAASVNEPVHRRRGITADKELRPSLRHSRHNLCGWLHHPAPTAREPDREVRRITGNPCMDLDDRTRFPLAASLAPADNVFRPTRRFLSVPERPIDTAS